MVFISDRLIRLSQILSILLDYNWLHIHAKILPFEPKNAAMSLQV